MARDKYHEIVKTALIKEGWLITDYPLFVEAGKRKIQVDLGAERLIAAEKSGEKIAVEIKSFIGISTLQDFYLALGQVNFYQYALEKKCLKEAYFWLFQMIFMKIFFRKTLLKNY